MITELNSWTTEIYQYFRQQMKMGQSYDPVQFDRALEQERLDGPGLGTLSTELKVGVSETLSTLLTNICVLGS